MNLIEKASAAFTWSKLKLDTAPGQGGIAITWDSLLTTVTSWIFLIAGIVAFFYLIYSGFTYLTAGGNADNAKKGQQGIINAIIGLVIIFLAYAIVAAVVNLLAKA
jgi:threonine/homoserine/homoserine lactone efflux protein